MTNINKGNRAVLLMHCPDTAGIIVEVTGFVTKNGGNILHLEQHVEREEDLFCMRVEWELDNFVIPDDKIEDYFQTLVADRFNMTFRVYFSGYKPRMAIFVSKLEHCLYDILGRIYAGEWEVEVPLIISNHPNMKVVADRYDIPFYCLPITKENKLEQEARQLELLAEYNIDFIILARYMQILSEQIITEYPTRIINIHHSFLPAFPRARPYHSAHARGVKIIGATSHYVTKDLDAGPIIEQDVVRVTHKEPVKELVRKGKDLEKLVLSRAIWNHLQRKVLVYNNRTVVFE